MADGSAKMLWSLTGAGPATTLSAGGNSGAWSKPGLTPNSQSAIDLRFVTDVQLFVSVGGITTTPTFTVSLSVFDNMGNAYAGIVTSGNITAAGTVTAMAGLHAATPMLLPSWGEIVWTCSGGSVTGTEIELWGR